MKKKLLLLIFLLISALSIQKITATDYIASASHDGTVKIWDMSGNLVTELPRATGISALASSKNGKYLAVGVMGTKHQIKIYDLSDIKEPRKLRSIWLIPDSSAHSLSFSNDPEISYLAATKEKYIKIWDISDKEAPREIFSPSIYDDIYSEEKTRPLKKKYRSTLFHPKDPNTLLITREDIAYLLNIVTKKYKIVEHNGKILSAAFNPEGTLFAFLSSIDKYNIRTKVLIKDYENPKKTKSFKIGPSSYGRGLSNRYFDSITFGSPTGKYLATLNKIRSFNFITIFQKINQKWEVIINKIEKREDIIKSKKMHQIGRNNSYSCVTFGGPQRGLLFAGINTGIIKVWDSAQDWKNIKTFKGHTRQVNCIVPINQDFEKAYEEKYQDISERTEFTKKMLEEKPQLQQKILVGPKKGPKKELKAFKSLLIETDKK